MRTLTAHHTVILALTALVGLSACETAPEERDVEIELGRHELELERRNGVVVDADLDRNVFEYDWGYEADFGEWDLDDDVRLDWDEYHAGWAALGLVRAWDHDDNGWLSDQEIAMGLFIDWDTDDSLFLDMAEFRRGARAWFDRPNTHGTFQSWEDDGDGRLSNHEFREGLVDRDVWDIWDGDHDKRLTDEELAKVLWTAWDVDNDGFIDALEYRWH